MTALDTIRNHVLELDGLERRMIGDEQYGRISHRAKEARSILRGMGDAEPTLGELHTAFYRTYIDGPMQATRIADILDTSDNRVVKVLTMLQGAGLIIRVKQGWTTPINISSPQEANKAFDSAFPGLSTIDLTKAANKVHAANSRNNIPESLKVTPPSNKEKHTMPSTKNTAEFTKSETKSDSKKALSVAKMIDILRKADGPVLFATDLCDQAGAKYPQDVEAAMFALEVLGLVEKHTLKEDGVRRPKIAFAWVGGDAPFVSTPSTTSKSSSKSSNARAKKSAPKAETNGTSVQQEDSEEA